MHACLLGLSGLCACHNSATISGGLVVGDLCDTCGEPGGVHLHWRVDTAVSLNVFMSKNEGQ